jgi:hypothetical protein
VTEVRHQDGIVYFVTVTSLCSTRHCIALWMEKEDEDPAFIKAGRVLHTRQEAVLVARKWAEELQAEYRE